jgi:hypothetical protein
MVSVILGIADTAMGPAIWAAEGTSVGTDASGMTLCAVYVCNQVQAYPDEAKACVNDVCRNEGALVAHVTDADNDTVSNLDELQGNSNPTDPDSTPDGNDDCDGKTNSQERDYLAAQGILHPYVDTEGEPWVNSDPVGVGHPGASLEWEEGSQPC